MAKKTDGAGFWHSLFPNQLGNLCFTVFLAGIALFILYAYFDLNVFDPDSFKSTDARIPELGTRRIVDEAGYLTSGEIDSLTGEIDAYEAASGGQFAVLIIRSLHGDALEVFSLATAEKWKLGWKGEDNGVLLLLAMDDHRSRLEIGTGLEGIITDARAGDILRGMAPAMHSEQYANAIEFVIRSVAAFVLHEDGPEPLAEETEDGDGIVHRSAAADDPTGTLGIVLALCVLFELIGTITARILIHPGIRRSFGLAAMIFIGQLLLEALKGSLRGGGGSSGSGGSSRSGGGGGGFSGGGASGRW